MTTVTTIKNEFEKIQAENPKLRIRDIAKTMKLGEAQLVALRMGDGVTRLEGDFKEMLKEMHTVGYVMALTRNDDAVHERKGIYNNISFDGHVGLALNEDIDLRLFMMHWQFGFAVQEGDRNSFQFFDKSGEAVHKIYLTETSDFTAYKILVDKYAAAEQIAELETAEYPAAPQEIPDATIDATSFQNEWHELKDTHDFFGLIRKYKLSRTQALRLAPPEYVTKVTNNAAQKMLEMAAEQQVPIMAFVASRGCIQIHTGTVTKLLATGPWFNVLDPEFNLHLRTEKIHTSYIVKKPSVDGTVTSLEIFDESGNMIIQFFGKRKPGVPELESWRGITNAL